MTKVKGYEKSIDTLIPDIHSLFGKEHTISEENLASFSANITEVVRDRISKSQKFDKPSLRVSKLGVKDRKLWYELNAKEGQKELEIDPRLCIMFMFGDLIEELLLLLCKEAGHTVEGEQGEVNIEGVLGHRDCIIDGITTDIKSASRFAFPKFSKGGLFNDDPFGYIAQISSYCHADDSPYGAFLAMNKETADLALLKVNPVDMIHPPTRVNHVKEMLAKDAPPELKCYPDEPAGGKGNRVLNKNCTYCPFKEQCWSSSNGGQGLRKFNYSNGVKYFTTVFDTPRVEEFPS